MRQPAGVSLEQAFALHRQGRLDAAEQAYRALLRRNPRDARVLHLMGLLAAQAGQIPRGIELIQRSLEIDPRRFLAYRDLGNILLQAQDFAGALVNFDQALALKPHEPEILDNRGTALRMLDRLADALASHDMALALSPGRALAHLNRGSALAGLNRLAEALESFDRAIALDEAFALAHSNRGSALHRLEQYPQALESHDRAVALAPGLAHAHIARGQTLAELGRYDEALASFTRALALDPQSAEAQFGRATALLITGRFSEGWQAYETRIRRVGAEAFHAQGRPRWLGREDIAGKTLFVEGEQGLGDMIQFCRFARLPADKGARVVLTAQASQVRLLQGLDPRMEVRPQDQPPAAFDYHVPLLSLPLAFGVPDNGFAAFTPYLKAEPERVERWRRHIGNDGLRIGICWQGGPGNPARSFPLAAVAPIASCPGVRLISLQKGPGSEQRATSPIPVESLGEDYDAGPDAFLDAAAVMETMDMVISCDTSIAHLAGALARPVWVALKFAPDWRYMTERDDSPWYPTMRLFRQDRPGDWQNVFAKMAEALAKRK